MAVAKCPRGHQWEAADSARDSCPYCGGPSEDTLRQPAVRPDTGQADQLPFVDLTVSQRPQRDQDATRGDSALQDLGRLDAALAPPAGPQVPGYDILELCGQGGMGVVYRAR